MSIETYVHQQVSALIERLAEEAARASQDASEDGVHHLRVAIRRLSESLRVFKDLFPPGTAKKVRRDLKVAMHLAGETRNHDIAKDLMRKAKAPMEPTHDAGRDRAAAKLMAVLQGWNENSLFQVWKDRLHA